MPITDTFGPPAYILVFLDQLAQALPRNVPKAEGIRIIAGVLDRAGLREDALREASMILLQEEDRFPSAAQIIRAAKRRGPMQTATEDTETVVDQEKAAREQLRIEQLWLDRFTKRGDEYHMRVCSGKIARLQGWLDRKERGIDHADVTQLIPPGDRQGFPNRAQVAAYTGDDEYLRSGSENPLPIAKILLNFK